MACKRCDTCACSAVIPVLFRIRNADGSLGPWETDTRDPDCDRVCKEPESFRYNESVLKFAGRKRVCKRACMLYKEVE